MAQGWSEGSVVYLGDGMRGVRESVNLPTPAAGYNDLDTGDVNGTTWTSTVAMSCNTTVDLALDVPLEDTVLPAAALHPCGHCTLRQLARGNRNNGCRGEQGAGHQSRQRRQAAGRELSPQVHRR
ncbi:hypothetical protein [Luteimonas sp. MC1895]|uniref:hypothetical protein n=1 Tax=Luteimonas sp. MC1895 TaxID=2819513 RepID=UPI0018F06EE4|nr:hypothetical protein [Luteimonas sp. MC1895]MBJ6979441.1 hypothetical protein [Luteimonas sp. MC1895]